MGNIVTYGNIIKLATLIVGTITVWTVVATYLKDKYTEKIDILIQMHAKFIENRDFHDIRYKIDRWDDELFKSIKYDTENPDNDKVDKEDEAKYVNIPLMGKFNDYLEFFLLVVNLCEKGPFTKKEIDRIFGYYLRLITENEVIWSYLNVEKYQFADIVKYAKALDYEIPADIVEIKSGSDRFLKPLFELYDRSFPPLVREDSKNIRQSINDSNIKGSVGGFHFLAASVKGVPVGFITLTYLPVENLGFVGYVVVNEKYRGRHIGRSLIGSAKEALDKDAVKAGKKSCRGVLFEVETEDLAENENDKEVRQKRIEYFEKLGAGKLPVDYWQPPMRSNEPGVKLHLMYYSNNKVVPKKDELVSFLNTVYDVIYASEDVSISAAVKKYREMAVNSIR
ncbi:MAG: GNAT family N-acetyltransferase [bacterium]|nr:GNAT family N-acetyltransferase [bacterium]